MQLEKTTSITHKNKSTSWSHTIKTNVPWFTQIYGLHPQKLSHPVTLKSLNVTISNIIIAINSLPLRAFTNVFVRSYNPQYPNCHKFSSSVSIHKYISLEVTVHITKIAIKSLPLRAFTIHNSFRLSGYGKGIHSNLTILGLLSTIASMFYKPRNEWFQNAPICL